MKKQSKAKKKKPESAKKIAENVLRVSSIMPIISYDAGKEAFMLSSGVYMSMFEIVTKDHNAFDSDAFDRENAKFSKLFNTYGGDLKLISSNFPVNTTAQQENIRRDMERTRHPVYLSILDRQIYEEQYIEKNITDRQYILVFYGKTPEELKDNYYAIKGCLPSGGAYPLIRDVTSDKKLSVVASLFNMNTLPEHGSIDMSQFSAPDYVPERELPKKALARLKEKVGLPDNAAENLVFDPAFMLKAAPAGGITFAHEDYIRLGDGYVSCLYVYQYAKSIGPGWLSRLTSIDETVAVIDISTPDQNVIKRNIARSMSEQSARYAALDGDNSIKMEAQRIFSELEEFYTEITAADDSGKSLVTRIYLYAPTFSELEAKVKEVSANLTGDGFRAAVCLNELKSDFNALALPASAQERNVYKKTGQAVLATQLAMGNPFNYASLSDPGGRFYGSSLNGGGIVNLDTARVIHQRMSYNSLLIGSMGSGKSSTAKKNILDRAARGDMIRIIDPTGEYAPLVHYLGGEIINLDGAGDSVINPLQILRSTADAAANYIIHISKLSTMYKYASPEVSRKEIETLRTTLRGLYMEHGFILPDGSYAPDITDRSPEDYPAWGDYLSYLTRIIEEEENDGRAGSFEHNLHKSIQTSVTDFVMSYGSIFNRKTKVKDLHRKQIVCFDVTQLTSMDSYVLDAQLFSTLSFAWDTCVAQGMEQKALYDAKKITESEAVHFWIWIDESHKFINANKLAGIEQIMNFERMGRKLFGGIGLISHLISDFIPDDATAEGAAEIKKLFSLATYKWILQQSTSEREKLRMAFYGQISEQELDLITGLEKGDVVLSIMGDRNIAFHIELSDSEAELFAGGA